MAEPRYEYVLRIPYGLKYLVDEYASSRDLSFNRAVTELLETHGVLQLIYQRLVIKPAGPAPVRFQFRGQAGPTDIKSGSCGQG